MAVAIVAAGLVVYTLGGSPYCPCNTLGEGRAVPSDDLQCEEEMPIMLAMPGAAALSMTEPAADWNVQNACNSCEACCTRDHLETTEGL